MPRDRRPRRRGRGRGRFGGLLHHDRAYRVEPWGRVVVEVAVEGEGPAFEAAGWWGAEGGAVAAVLPVAAVGGVPVGPVGVGGRGVDAVLGVGGGQSVDAADEGLAPAVGPGDLEAGVLEGVEAGLLGAGGAGDEGVGGGEFLEVDDDGDAVVVGAVTGGGRRHHLDRRHRGSGRRRSRCRDGGTTADEQGDGGGRHPEETEPGHRWHLWRSGKPGRPAAAPRAGHPRWTGGRRCPRVRAPSCNPRQFVSERPVSERAFRLVAGSFHTVPSHTAAGQRRIRTGFPRWGHLFSCVARSAPRPPSSRSNPATLSSRRSPDRGLLASCYPSVTGGQWFGWSRTSP